MPSDSERGAKLALPLPLMAGVPLGREEEAGVEDLSQALTEAEGLEGWPEGGATYASFRAACADEVALRFLAANDEAVGGVMAALRGPVFGLSSSPRVRSWPTFSVCLPS